MMIIPLGILLRRRLCTAVRRLLGTVRTLGAVRRLLTGAVRAVCGLIGGRQSLNLLIVAVVEGPGSNAVQLLAARHLGVVDPLLDDGPRQVLLRHGGDLLVGQLLAQKDMVAVAALYDIADLAGLESEGGVLELLDKVGVRVDEVAVLGGPARSAIS